jgi:hypothetical protein
VGAAVRKLTDPKFRYVPAEVHFAGTEYLKTKFKRIAEKLKRKSTLTKRGRK